jgi:hypothetical protein
MGAAFLDIEKSRSQHVTLVQYINSQKDNFDCEELRPLGCYAVWLL